MINIIPARQMECFLKSSWIYLTCPSGGEARGRRFGMWEELLVCRFGLTWSPSMRPNNESKAEKKALGVSVRVSFVRFTFSEDMLLINK